MSFATAEDEMIVADLMTKDLVTVLPETSLADAARIMLARHLSGLLVLDHVGALLGVVTEGDLIQRTELGTDDGHPTWLKAFLMPSRLAADYVKTHGRHVSEVMTSPPECVTPQTALEVAAAVMHKRHIKRLPVVENGRPVGVISRSDLLGALARKLIQTSGSKPSDEVIGDNIKATLEKESWAPKSGIHVLVTNGVVTLEGVIMSDEEHKAVRVIAENAIGVMDVEDRLVFVDPGSGMAFPVGG
jgi:CBS domain-containing protein